MLFLETPTDQNLMRRLVRSLRMSFVRSGNPNCGLVTSVLTLAYVTRFSTLVASSRQSMDQRSHPLFTGFIEAANVHAEQGSLLKDGTLNG